VDQQAPVKIRGAAQGFLAFATFGVGWFLGSWSAGKVVQFYSFTQGVDVVGHHWEKIWVIPAAAAAVVLVLFQLFFRPRLAIQEAASQKA
jgi:MFS family permease